MADNRKYFYKVLKKLYKMVVFEKNSLKSTIREMGKSVFEEVENTEGK